MAIKIKSLRDERDSYHFLQGVMGMLWYTEHVIEHLEDENREFSSDDLTMVVYKGYYDQFAAFVGNPDKVKAFKKIYPAHAHFADHIADVLPAIQRIRQARYDILTPHLNDAKDALVVDDTRGVQGVSNYDRAAMMGLTLDQLALHDAHLDRFGHFLLSMTERRTLAAAMRAELEDAPGEPDAATKKARHDKRMGSRTRRNAGTTAPAIS